MSYGPFSFFSRAGRTCRALGRAIVFFLKVFPMLPSRPIDWITKAPVVEKVCYPTCNGQAEGDLYLPSTPGPHPGILVCLGVVPFGVEHPQVPILGRALARSGFAALLYWSPAMRDFRLDPVDITNIPLAYDWLIHRTNIDPTRSGLLGTCVGGAFALMSAAQPLIRDHIGFVSAYAPFASMWTFGRDIASHSRTVDGEVIPWKVDQLTRHVFVQSMTAWLDSSEAERLRRGFASADGVWEGGPLSTEGQVLYDLFTAPNPAAAEAALHRLSEPMQQRLTDLSPLTYIRDVRAPLIAQLHDIGDQVIPVDESRRLQAVIGGRPGVGYTEMNFSHLDPVKGHLPLTRLVRELGKFFMAVFPMFKMSVP
jgi:hypothetical protein